MEHWVSMDQQRCKHTGVLSTYYSENMGIENEDVYASFRIVFSDYSTMHNVPEWSGTL